MLTAIATITALILFWVSIVLSVLDKRHVTQRQETMERIAQEQLEESRKVSERLGYLIHSKIEPKIIKLDMEYRHSISRGDTEFTEDCYQHFSTLHKAHQTYTDELYQYPKELEH